MRRRLLQVERSWGARVCEGRFRLTRETALCLIASRRRCRSRLEAQLGFAQLLLAKIVDLRLNSLLEWAVRRNELVDCSSRRRLLWQALQIPGMVVAFQVSYWQTRGCASSASGRLGRPLFEPLSRANLLAFWRSLEEQACLCTEGPALRLLSFDVFCGFVRTLGAGKAARRVVVLRRCRYKQRAGRLFSPHCLWCLWARPPYTFRVLPPACSKLEAPCDFVLWKVLRFARVWLCLDACASLGILGPRSSFCGRFCILPGFGFVWMLLPALRFI